MFYIPISCDGSATSSSGRQLIFLTLFLFTKSSSDTSAPTALYLQSDQTKKEDDSISVIMGKVPGNGKLNIALGTNQNWCAAKRNHLFYSVSVQFNSPFMYIGLNAGSKVMAVFHFYVEDNAVFTNSAYQLDIDAEWAFVDEDSSFFYTPPPPGVGGLTGAEVVRFIKT